MLGMGLGFQSRILKSRIKVLMSETLYLFSMKLHRNHERYFVLVPLPFVLMVVHPNNLSIDSFILLSLSL